MKIFGNALCLTTASTLVLLQKQRSPMLLSVNIFSNAPAADFGEVYLSGIYNFLRNMHVVNVNNINFYFKQNYFTTMMLKQSHTRLTFRKATYYLIHTYLVTCYT